MLVTCWIQIFLSVAWIFSTCISENFKVTQVKGSVLLIIRCLYKAYGPIGPYTFPGYTTHRTRETLKMMSTITIFVCLCDSYSVSTHSSWSHGFSHVQWRIEWEFNFKLLDCSLMHLVKINIDLLPHFHQLNVYYLYLFLFTHSWNIQF